MGAAVRVDAEAFTDERYVTLARLAGLTDSDHARGKMLRLWRQCTDRHVETLSVEICESVLGANASEALIKSELGESVEGGIRIRGTAGRIEWLEKLRSNGKKGGKANAKQLRSKTKANQEMEKEIDPSHSSEALSAADLLRTAIVSQQPNHQLTKIWSAAMRRKWAEQLASLNAAGRSWDQISAVVQWLFYGQTGDARFVVQSPASLAEKWDRIEAIRSRPPSRQAPGRQEPQRNMPWITKS